MMLGLNWLTVGILSAALFGLIGFIDKLVIDRYYWTVWSYPFFTMLFFGLYCAGILFYRIATGVFEASTFWIMLIALLPGITHFIAGILTTKALMQADAATVFGLSQVSPVFAIFWSLWIFDSIFQWHNYAGILLIVVCALLLGLNGSRKKFRLNAAIWWILAATFIRSISDLSLKFALTEMEYWDAFALSRSMLAIFALALLLVPKIRIEIFKPVRQHGLKLIGIAGLIETFAVLNLMLVTLAFSLGPLALVSATQSTLPLFIIIYAVIANRIKRDFMPIQNRFWKTREKIFLSIGIVFGVYLLYVR